MTEHKASATTGAPAIRKTAPFRTTSGEYFSVLLKAWMVRYGWLMLIPTAFFVALGYALHDERWLLVALMTVFIVAPMVMSFIYTYYMLTPEARRAVLRKRVEIAEGEYIRLIYLPSENTSDDRDGLHDADPDIKADMKNHGPETEEKVPEPETISWTEITKVRSTQQYRVYETDGKRMQFILVPWSSFLRDSQQVT
ncbi:hypothetical protein [uncultured Duncaniella sp.]|uniref:hypothetical protein n=1 Tax=uncultured Duncaniella sp. TaxID=2768039 RepID=UPI0025FE1830|nr:hypothetical protein [uncultured Duncaniella sp.]